MYETIKFGMCSDLILSRLNELNQQLTIISKLQKMDEGVKINGHLRYKKYDIQNNFRKPCHCAHHVSSKEQCNWFNYTENIKKKMPCNLETCKARKAICICRSSRFNAAQRELRKDVEVQENTDFVERSTTNDSMKQGERKSDQASISSIKVHVTDKMIDPYGKKEADDIPSQKMKSQDKLNKNDENHERLEGTNKMITQNVNELGSEYSKQDRNVEDKKDFEGIHKDLLNEKKRTKELEEKLQSLTCSLNCLKEDNEQRAACLKDALETAEKQSQLAITSKNLALDLAKQSKEQADIIKGDKEKLLSQIAGLQRQVNEIEKKNVNLMEERNDLQRKLEFLSEDEAKRCGEVKEEVNRLKCAIKEKEGALCKETKEFTKMISELTNVIKIQKRRICEITALCNNQQLTLKKKDEELSQRNNELSEIQNTLKCNNSNCKEIKEEMEHLKYCLCEEAKACNCFKEELKNLKESQYSELRIKEKIIEEQNRTISRQKKLLNDSEKMAQQLAYEFDQLKEELYHERQNTNSLQIALDDMDIQLRNAYSQECKNCKIHVTEVHHLNQEKQKALTTAKFAIQKLYCSLNEHKKQLAIEKRQHRYVALILRKKEQEIQYLKNKIGSSSARCIKQMESYIIQSNQF